MPLNSSGLFSRLHRWVSDRDSNIKILASRMDEEFDGIASAINTITSGGVPLRGPVKNVSGTQAAPAYSFASDPDTGVYNPSADRVGLAAGPDRLVFGGGQLAVNGDVLIDNNTKTNGQLARRATANTFTGSQTIDATQASLIFETDTAGRQAIAVRVNGVQVAQLRVRADGAFNFSDLPLYAEGSPVLTHVSDLATIPGDVRSLVFCRNDSGAAIGMGAAVSGASLRQAGIGANGVISVGTTPLTGGWMCHGFVAIGHVTLFRRVT